MMVIRDMVGSGFFRRADVHIISFCEWPCLTLGPALMRLRQSHSRRTRSRLPYGCYPAPLGLRQTNRVCTAVVSPCGFQFGNIGHRPAKYIDRNQLRKVTRTLAKNEIGAMGIPPYHIGGSCLVRFRSRGAVSEVVTLVDHRGRCDILQAPFVLLSLVRFPVGRGSRHRAAQWRSMRLGGRCVCH
jgi:hypothetical protein